MNRPLKHHFILEEEGRCDDRLDPALEDEVHDATARAIAAAKGGDEDGCVEDEAHGRRLSH
jgi:hypothetical protein